VKLYVVDILSLIPVFDSFLKKKVLYPALVAAYGTFINFTDARYAILMLAVIKKRKPSLRYAPAGPGIKSSIPAGYRTNP
jgi:hypothetical protein